MLRAADGAAGRPTFKEQNCWEHWPSLRRVSHGQLMTMSRRRFREGTPFRSLASITAIPPDSRATAAKGVWDGLSTAPI